MDPLSQGVLGATYSQSSVKEKRYFLYATILGAFGGMAPDLDIFIRSESDPLLFLEYHRHFTHSLFFIPLGGLICALIFHLFLRKKLSFKKNYQFTTIGYATHGLLDSCTTYGTQLLWPFTNHRFAFNTISIIDPLYTFPLLLLVLLAVFRKKVKFAYIAVFYSVFYMGIGLVQNHRAENIGLELAEKRGLEVVSISAKPTLANIFLWKIVTETKDRYYVDAVRILRGKQVFEGESVAKFDYDRDMPWLDKNSVQAKDVERFRWFSGGFIALDPMDPLRVIDVRYSMIPNEVEALWGIYLNPKTQDQHAEYANTRDASGEKRAKFWQMLKGELAPSVH